MDKLRSKVSSFKNFILSKTSASQLSNPCLITQIAGNLYHMPFPTQQLRAQILSEVKSRFGSSFMIWNVSQNKYDPQPFSNQVCDACYPAYPHLPLNQSLLIATNIKKWLTADPSNIAIIHCKEDKSRSAIMIALYCFLDKQYAYVDEALIETNIKLGIRKDETIFPSQKLAIRNCMNLINGFPRNKSALRIMKVNVNRQPTVTRDNGSDFRPYLEVILNKEKIFSQGKQLEDTEGFSFTINKTVKDDFLLWMKHEHSKTIRYSCFRVLLNTNFITEPYVRLRKSDLDITKNIEVADNFFVDVYFEPEKEQTSFLDTVLMEANHIFKLDISLPKKSEVDTNLKTYEIKQTPQEMTAVQLSNDFAISQSTEQHQKPKITKDVQKNISELLKRIEVKDDEEEDMDDYISKLEAEG